MRVLVHDTDVVMYDTWWPHLNNWGLADLNAITRKRINYYAVGVSTVLEKATYAKSDPLSAAERSLHRPDLPLTAARSATTAWSRDTPDRLAEGGSELKVAQLYLFPFGPDGGFKPGVRVTPDNGTSFTAEELMRKAQNAQAPHIAEVVPVTGAGIYRLGLQRGIPAFYLWGAESRMH